ncbi:MAG TPA: DUF1634 domain-containing protein [Bryobacteraceae bacterium]|jgi:uncharacterized membrane protein|nr:DUF1634 domain-containing protein [Bryobacteraceae bacterium]
MSEKGQGTYDRDQQMEASMGVLLRNGVITCCAVMVAGAVLYLVRHGNEQASYAKFHGEPPALESIRGVLGQVRAGSARGIIQLAALLMIATPVLRVVIAVFDFARMKDWKFTAISLAVLGLLAFGLFGTR